MKKALFVAALALSAQAQVFVIDDFEAAPFTQTGTSTTFTSYEGPEANIIGGERQARMSHGDFVLPNPSTTVADGILTFNETDPSALVLRYGASDAEPDKHLHLDLSAPSLGEEYHFTIEVTSMSTPFNGAFGLYSFISDASSVSHRGSGMGFTIFEPGTYSYNFSRLGGNVDMSDIAGIQIEIGVGPGNDTGTYSIGDVRIEPLTVIPEPGTYAAIFAFGLLGFAAGKRLFRQPPGI